MVVALYLGCAGPKSRPLLESLLTQSLPTEEIGHVALLPPVGHEYWIVQ